MKKTLNARKWLLSFAAGVLAMLLVLSAVIYAVDPFFQFRVRDNTYALDGRFANAGLIKNYDYDTLFLGSSMTQNFHMDQVREVMGVKPLHANMGGMEPHEQAELINLAAEVGKAKVCYLDVRLGMFSTWVQGSKNPQYLLGDDILSRLQYAVSYEAWFRYMPTNLRILLSRTLSGDKELYRKETSIDMLGNWEDEEEIGEERVIEEFNLTKDDLYSRIFIESYAAAINGIDRFFRTLQPGDMELVFFFPPFSAAHWYVMGEKNMASHMDRKDYFVQKATELGYTVYDFQAEEFICNLDIYRDLTHYNGDINDWMVECFHNKTHIVTPGDMPAQRERMYQRIEELKEKYPELT